MKAIKLILLFLIAFGINGFAQKQLQDKKVWRLQVQPDENLVRPADNNSTVAVYPNPDNGNFYVKIGGFTESPELEIYNLNAEHIVYQAKLNRLVNKVNLTRYAKGVYIYRVYGPVDGLMVASGKIMIQ